MNQPIKPDPKAKPDMFTRPTAVIAIVSEPNHQTGLWAKLGVLGALLGTMVILAQPLTAQSNDKENDFLDAILRSDLNAVKNMVRKGFNVNAKQGIKLDANEYFEPLWFQALKIVPCENRSMNRKQVEIVKFLIEKGVDMNARGVQGQTALMSAIGSGNVEVVKLLIEKGADVNAKDEYGKFPTLSYALRDAEQLAKNIEIAKLLIEKGADVNAKDEHQCFSALFYATGAGNIELVKLLIAKGADVNANAGGGFTVLMNALQPLSPQWAEKGCNVEIIKLLIEKGADVNAKDEGGNTVAHYVPKDKPEIANLLKTIPAQKPAAGQSAATPETSSAPSTPAPAVTPIDANRFICSTDIMAFNPTDPKQIAGQFKAGSTLILGSKDNASSLIHVTYSATDGTVVRMLCKPQDVGR